MPYFHAPLFFFGLLAIVGGIGIFTYGARSGEAQTREANLITSVLFPWMAGDERFATLYFRGTYMLCGAGALAFGLLAVFASLFLPVGRHR